MGVGKGEVALVDIEGLVGFVEELLRLKEMLAVKEIGLRYKGCEHGSSVLSV